jgi:hypothetical protein
MMRTRLEVIKATNARTRPTKKARMPLKAIRVSLRMSSLIKRDSLEEAEDVREELAEEGNDAGHLRSS